MNKEKEKLTQELKDHFSKNEIEHIWSEGLHTGFTWTNEDSMQECIDRLLEDEPFQYIFGRAYFYDFELTVSPNVLIPRPETEELVHLISTDFKGLSPKILDIGTGSGCIPIALAKLLPEAEISALDVSPKALQIAIMNAVEHEVDIQFIEADILNDVLIKSYDVIVSNPPYIPHKEKSLMQENVLQYEPHLALFVEDEDPLIFYRKIAELAQISLIDSGKIYFECNEFNAKEVALMLEDKLFKEVEIIKDMQGKDRMIKAHK